MLHRPCTPSAEGGDNASIDIELVPKAVVVDFGTVMQLSAHTETRIVVVENQTEQDVVLDIEQTADDRKRTPMTVSSKRLRVLSAKRVEVEFVLNTSLQEGNHSFGFRVGLQPGASRTLGVDDGDAYTDVIAKVEVRRPSVRLQTKHIQLGPVAARTGKLERTLELVNDSDVPVRIKAAVQQDQEFAVDVTVKPSNTLLGPNKTITLVARVDTDTTGSKGKLIASTIIVAVGSSDNLLQCSCTGYLVESCVALGILPQAAEHTRNPALKIACEEPQRLHERFPLSAIDVAEMGRTQVVNGFNGKPLYSVHCSSLYFAPGSTNAPVNVQSHRPTEHIKCWVEIKGLNDSVELRCVPPTLDLEPKPHGKLDVTTGARAGCAGIAGKLVISGTCTGGGCEVPTRIAIPIGGALLPKEIRLPDVEFGETSLVGLFLVNHSVANMPFRLGAPVLGEQPGHSQCLRVEPGKGDLGPGELIQVDMTFKSRPDQPAGEVKGLLLASAIGGCPKTDIPVRVRVGHINMAIESTTSPIQVDLSNMKKYCTQGDKRFCKLQGLSVRVKNIGDITAALTEIEGVGITLVNSAQARREIQPNEEREIDVHVALGSLVDSKRELMLQFGSFRLGCAWKTKIDGPKLAFERPTNKDSKRIQMYELGVIGGQLPDGIDFCVKNGGNRTLRYRLVGSIVMSGGAVDVKVTVGQPPAEDSKHSRELIKKGSDRWCLHIEEMIPGPIGIMVTFEAENQPTLAPDGEVLKSSRHSLLFSGYVNLNGSAPGLHQTRCETPHESGFEVPSMAFVRLAIDRTRTLEARALGMPLATCSMACLSNASKKLKEQSEDELAPKIVALDPTVIKAVLGGATVGPDAATLAIAIKSAVAARVPASAIVLAGAALHEFAAYLPKRSMLFELAVKLLQDTPYEAGLDTCEHFLSLDACRPNRKGREVCGVGTPTLPCWTRFRELAEPPISSAISLKDLSDRTVHVLSVESKAAEGLQPFLAGLRNLTRTGVSGADVWEPLAVDLRGHLDRVSKALVDVCAEPAVGTSKWIEFIASLALGEADLTCAPAIQLILKGKEADTDTVFQIAFLFFGGYGGRKSGERWCDVLRGLKEWREAPGTPRLYTQHFLRACGGGLAKVARIFEFESNAPTAPAALGRLACIWEFLTYGRKDLTRETEPLVNFFRKTRDAVALLTELSSKPPPETAEPPQVVVENATELLALTQHELLDDMATEAALFLERFTNNEEMKKIDKRQRALLQLHNLLKIKTGTRANQKDVFSALANLARITSSKHDSFATWIEDVSSSTSPGIYSIADGVEVLRKLSSVREVGRQGTQLRRLVDVLDRMEVFRKAGQDVDCGRGIMKELVYLVRDTVTQPQMQDSINRIAEWVDICGDHESPKKRLDAYIVKCGLPAPKLEELHRSACEFNNNPRLLNVEMQDMDSLHHMQELYTMVLEESNWSMHVVSHVVPLMYAVHMLQNMADDDIQYETAFASFLAVVSLLKLERDDMLCVNSSGPGSADVPSVDTLPPPPSSEQYQAAPPTPPTNADESSGKQRGKRATSREALDPSSCGVGSSSEQGVRSEFDAAGGAGSSSTCGGQPISSSSTGGTSVAGSGAGCASDGAVAGTGTAGMGERSGCDAAGGAGSSSTCRGQNTIYNSTGGSSIAGSSAGCAREGAVAGTSTAGIGGRFSSRHAPPRSTVSAGPDTGKYPSDRDSGDAPSHSAVGGKADLPEGGAATCSGSAARERIDPHPAPELPLSTAFGSTPGAAGRSKEDTASASPGVRVDQGNDGLGGSPGLGAGVRGSSGDPTSCSARSASVRDGQNASMTDLPGSREEKRGPPGVRGDPTTQTHNGGDEHLGGKA